MPMGTAYYAYCRRTLSLKSHHLLGKVYFGHVTIDLLQNLVDSFQLCVASGLRYGNIQSTLGNILSTLENVQSTLGNILSTLGNIVSQLGPHMAFQDLGLCSHKNICIKMIDASACFGPGGGSQFEGYPLPSSRRGASFSRCAPAATDPKVYAEHADFRPCGRV
jgi:hypothetical protein